MHRIALVVSPGFPVLALSLISAFELANDTLDAAAYSISLLSEHGGPVAASAGFSVETQPFGAETFDTVMFVASSHITPSSAATLRFARHAMKTARRVAGPCIGAFVLAESGLLDGRRVTTHWHYAHELQQRFPRIEVEPDRIYLVDGPVWTSAGMTASLDLALAMIEKDHGTGVARSIARKLVMYHRRAGGQSQFSALLELEPKSDRIQRALEHARGNLASELSVEALAGIAHLSPRQFSRSFHAETGQSPAKAIERLRVEAARLMLEEGQHPVEIIAREVGFGDRERMRRSFLRTLGQPPQALRRSAPAKRPADRPL